MNRKAYAQAASKVRAARPLVHHLTNFVTVNDCANITLCAGGAPVMADAPEEVEEMIGTASALVLNIGTLNTRLVESMLRAGRAANRRSIPVVLDPVGVGATTMRTEAAKRILAEVDVAVIKGNPGEIGVLAGTGGIVRGVDSVGAEGDFVTVASRFARSAGGVIVISGPTDVVSNGKRTFLVDNGHSMMGRISGTGCMAASVIGAFVGANDDVGLAVTAALVSFGIAGQKAAAGAQGPGTFKPALFDELARQRPEEIEQMAKVREV